MLAIPRRGRRRAKLAKRAFPPRLGRLAKLLIQHTWPSTIPEFLSIPSASACNLVEANHRDVHPEPPVVASAHPAHPVDHSSTTVQNEPRSDQPAVPTAAMPLMSRLSPTLCEFARPLSYAGRQAAAVIGRGGPESGSDSSLGSVSAGQTDSGVHPDSIPCGAAPHGGPVSAGTPTPVVLALAAGVEDGFDDEPGVLAGIARTFLSVAIVFAMTMGLWTASRSPTPQPGSNQPAVAGAAAFPGPAAQSSTSPSGRYRTKPIGEIRTGERVLAANPLVDHAVVTASEIDPATWRNIRLRMRKQHGGTLEIVLLRPLAWLAEQIDEFNQLAAADFHTSVPPHAVREGRDRTGWQLDSDVGQDTGWIHLALPELGAVGPAEVLAIEPCPPLASGPGRTVTGTFAHAAADVLDLEIEGLDTPLGCTANHPFWSADRQDFVPAGSLTIGEHLRTESGTLRQVTRITPRRGPPVAVFNLEVDAEHVYYVSTAGVLVHNAYPGGDSGSIGAKTWQEYEANVRSLYGEASFETRKYKAIIDGEVVKGVADNVATIAGRNVAVEAKFVQDRWAKSLRNPNSLIGTKPFAAAEQARMLEQARKYSAAFDEVIYHSNCPDFIAHYTKVFQHAGITRFRFILTH